MSQRTPYNVEALATFYFNRSFDAKIMTLIDSKIFDTIAISLGTALFVVIIFWTVWYGSRLK